MISLVEAAEAAKTSKSTMLRAVKKGKVSGVLNDKGAFEIDPSELCRAFPAAADYFTVKSDEAPSSKSEATNNANDALIASLNALLEAEKRLSDEIRNDRDAWREQAQRLALPNSQNIDKRGVFARLFNRG